MSSNERNARVEEKYGRIHTEGLLAICCGDVQPFRGFPPTMRNRWNVSFHFDDASQWGIHNNLLAPLQTLEKETKGLKFFLSHRDFPVHSTVGEGEHRGQAGVEEALNKRCYNESGAEKLVGLRIYFNELLFDRGNILLCAPEIPEAILEVREKLNRLYAEVGKALPIEDMLHITVARIASLPESFTPYLDALKLRDQILERGFTLAVGSVFSGPWSELGLPVQE